MTLFMLSLHVGHKSRFAHVEPLMPTEVPQLRNL
jgi:hypothetical protein